MLNCNLIDIHFFFLLNLICIGRPSIIQAKHHSAVIFVRAYIMSVNNSIFKNKVTKLFNQKMFAEYLISTIVK